MTPEVEREAQITQSYWMEIRHIVRCIYRDNMTLQSEFLWILLDIPSLAQDSLGYLSDILVIYVGHKPVNDIVVKWIVSNLCSSL